MKTAIIAASLFLAIAGSAAAQPGMAPLPPAPPVQAGEPTSEGVALGLSLGGTLVSWSVVLVASGFSPENRTTRTIGAIGGLGTMIAPSLGHWYAGTYFTRGMALRLAGAATAVLGLAMLIESSIGEDADDNAVGLGVAALYGGLGMYFGGTIDDIVTAPRRAERRNRERAGLGLAPLVTPSSAGLALGGRF